MFFFSSIFYSGCEMLYVIDQRLKAQNITLDKSVQGEYYVVKKKVKKKKIC